MHLVCLDLEGVLVPEIWIAVAKKTGIEELNLTTRDIPDYHELMQHRLKILAEHDLRLPYIQEVIENLEPLEGAEAFLNSIREQTQLIILSDTFLQFASPLMRKLGWPTLFCNELQVDGEGRITGYELRQEDGKRKAVAALRSIGFSIVAAGDSYNDVTMLQEAEEGILFRAPQSIKKKFLEFPTAETHPQLLEIIEKFLGNL